MKLSSILLEMLNEIGGKTYELTKPKISKKSNTINVVKYFFSSEVGDYEVLFESKFRPIEMKTTWKEDMKYKWQTVITFDKVREHDEYQDLYMFSDDEEHSETGEGDAIAILFTVANAVKAFIEEFKPELLTYSGSLSAKELSASYGSNKGDDDTKNLTVRDRIYDKMVQDMISKFPDYSFRRSGDNMEIFYKGELPVPGHHKIFNYPVKK
jgi:hypothetical protein